MDANHKKCCPNCSQLYQLKSVTPPKGNLPLFLKCGHSTCETCLRNIIKFAEPIECKICFRSMEISASDLALFMQNKIKIDDLFPVNIYMLGELTLQLMKNNVNFKQGPEENSFIDLQSILKSTDNAEGQCIECHTSTNKMCQQCSTILCETCFNKTHKNFVLFKNHHLQNVEPFITDKECKIHKGKQLDYYCKECSKSVCMDCLMVGGEKSCKNHNVVSMQEVNEGFVEELNDMFPKVDETFRRLTKTAVDIGNILHNIENETGPPSESSLMLANIEQHFSKLCCTLQKHKQEVINIIISMKSAEKESLKKAKNDVAQAIKKAKLILNTLTAILSPNKKINQSNLSVLLEDTKYIADFSWYLRRNESQEDSLKLLVNENICTLISDYVHLEGNINSVYKLVSTAELGHDIEIPPPPVAPVFPPELPRDVRKIKKQKEKPVTGFYTQVPTYHSKSGSNSSLNTMGSGDSSHRSYEKYYTNDGGYQKPVIQPVMPFPDSQHPKQLQEGSQEIIYISHIVDPHNFFVQRACHQKLVKEMLRDFRNVASLPKPSVTHIAEGKLYLVFNKADNMWQRCRVLTIDRKDINSPKIQVFCIDFGSTEVVSVDKLRLLPPARVQSPFPLAINCSLANCEPKIGSWTSDDAFLIQNIIDNKQAVIHVRRILSTSNYNVKLECDVITYEDGVSLAHALVFHERAKMPNRKLQYPKIECLTEKPKLFINNHDFKPKSVEEVVITHIVSPDKFYIRKRHLQNVYEKLCEDLDQEYSLANAGNIYLPEIGMVCVVNVEKYRSRAEQGAGGGAGGGAEGGGLGAAAWARAVVREAPGRGRVRVWLPDTGGSLLAHWSALRTIRHKFTTLRALSTECHLAGITPLNKKWSIASVALLQKFEDNFLEVHIEDNVQNRGSLGVTLYDKTDEENIICINKEMVKYKFAISFGLFMFNKNDTADQVITNKSPIEDSQSRLKQTDTVNVQKKNQLTNKKIEDKDLEAKDKGPLRLESKILCYQSPSLFYVSLAHQQKTFSDLFEAIQKYYTKNKTETKNDWKVNDRCCALSKQSNTWRRAVIIELEHENAKIFFSDFASVETLPLSGLRELTPDFTAIGDAAVRCHLYGVIPAVGEEWPSLTKEYLKDLFDAYNRIFITKLGSFKNKSLPVEVWVYHTIQGGALEPNKSEWRCLNKKIIEQGLGVPDKSQEVASTSSNNEDDDDMLSFLNVQGSVRDWLQLEPMPTKPLIIKTDVENNASECESPVDENTSRKMEGKSHIDETVFISDWLAPEPIQSNEFTAMPTYIDNDGIIYLHDIAQQDTLDLIRKALDVRFKDPDPKAKYTKWTVGEPCVALFFLDNRFYRGRVLEVNNETSTCLIHYIDYGNEEICSFANLRKTIALYQIPIQAHKCILNRIRPIGNQWDRTTLDYIHKSIVEKQCLVRVTGEPVGDIIPIDLKYNKLWINDHLVEFEMAVYTDGSKAVVRKFAPNSASDKDDKMNVIVESDSSPDYIVVDDNSEKSDDIEEDLELPSSHETSFDLRSFQKNDWNELIEEDEEQSLDGNFIMFPKYNEKEFLCNITIINEVNILELNIIHEDETNVLYDELFEKLQEEGENMAPLNGIFENKACIAIFPEDGQWYRASILQYSEEQSRIKVRYVDYGNIEVISLADVREINKEWTKLPPSSVAVRLHGVKINPDVDVSEITQEYADTFIDKGPFYVKVIEDTKGSLLPSVEIRNEEGKLVYDNLINKKLFLKM